MATYYAAVKMSGKHKWGITHRIEMPEQSCLASAQTMAWAAGLKFDAILRPCNLSQKNVRPITVDVPAIQYDAAKYLAYRNLQTWREVAQ